MSCPPASEPASCVQSSPFSTMPHVEACFHRPDAQSAAQRRRARKAAAPLTLSPAVYASVTAPLREERLQTPFDLSSPSSSPAHAAVGAGRSCRLERLWVAVDDLKAELSAPPGVRKGRQVVLVESSCLAAAMLLVVWVLVSALFWPVPFECDGEQTPASPTFARASSLVLVFAAGALLNCREFLSIPLV